jgi:cytochrome c peroxidase
MTGKSVVATAVALIAFTNAAQAAEGPTEKDKIWLMPKTVPAPADNQPNADRVALGKMLFFDPRLSRDGNMSCGTCHSPLFGWSDGLPTGRGFQSKALGRASPTVVNTAYNTIQLWDGRKKSLEEQAMGPMEANSEMNIEMSVLFAFLNVSSGYRVYFEKAYPGEPIDANTLSKAIASFERTVVSTNSPFDRWLHGDANAMTAQQLRGFRVFKDPNGGNCAVCHQPPNFTDNGFHNVGLPSWGMENPDVGRYAFKPVKTMKGAFKTPTLRDIDLTGPYFHDGSAKALMDVVEHYNQGGKVKTNLAPDLKELNLTQEDKEALVAFMHALTSPQTPFTLPVLPR